MLVPLTSPLSLLTPWSLSLSISRFRSVSSTSSVSSDSGSHRRGTPFGLLYQQYGSQLTSMVSAFDELEMELRKIPSLDKSVEEVASAEKRHTKLVTFIKHLRKGEN
jgi:hypothetical protein